MTPHVLYCDGQNYIDAPCGRKVDLVVIRPIVPRGTILAGLRRPALMLYSGGDHIRECFAAASNCMLCCHSSVAFTCVTAAEARVSMPLYNSQTAEVAELVKV